MSTPRWEHKVANVSIGDDGARTVSDRELSGRSLEDYLKATGDEGWELTIQIPSSSDFSYDLIFKRRVTTDS
jgi:hypothetical protein